MWTVSTCIIRVRVLICIVHTATSIRLLNFDVTFFLHFLSHKDVCGRLTMWIMSAITFLAGYSCMTGRLHVQRTLIPDPPTRVSKVLSNVSCQVYYMYTWLVKWTYIAQVLTTPFPIGNVPYGGSNVLLGSVPKPTMCVLCPLQNKHVFNIHLNYMYLT